MGLSGSQVDASPTIVNFRPFFIPSKETFSYHPSTLPSPMQPLITRGDPKIPVCHLLEGSPLVAQASPTGGCSRNPSVPVYELALLWEAAFSSSEYFLKTQRICPFHDGWLTSAPAHTTLSVQFLTKIGMTPMPHPPYWLFFVSPDEKVLQGKHFVDVEVVKQKTEALKGIKINELKNCFE